jgi:capsular exopolysaccharide synthesis family protein
VSARAFGQGVEQRGAVRYLAALRERWLLLVALVVLAVGAAVAYVETAHPRYQAEADVLVTPLPDGDSSFLGFSLLREGTDPSRAVLTAGTLVSTPQVVQIAARNLHTKPAAALGAITVSPVTQSSFVAISASSGSPARAAQIANAFADALIAERTAEFQQQLNARVTRLRQQLDAIPLAQRLQSAAGASLETELGELTSLIGSKDPTLQILARAAPPASPVWPRKTLSVAIAFLAALILGAGVALALELVSPRINQEDELLLEQRLPILARIPRMSAGRVRAYLAGREPLPGAVREAYRTLRASLEGGNRGEQFPHTLLITSASPGEGKTMTSVNLATTLAAAGQRVVLIDGDLRRPMVATVFGVGRQPNGFADVLSGRGTLSEALVEAPAYGDRLRLLLAAPDHAQLVDLLQADRIDALLAELRLEADAVVIDSPPLGEVADALALADASDAVVVAVRLGRTRRDKLTDLRRMLARHDITPTGFVVTARRRRRALDTYYGHSPERKHEGPRVRGEPPRVKDPETV